MYKAADLNVYPYFRDDLSDYPIAAVLDALTGVVSRACLIQFVQDLMARKIPFTLGIVDLDNFKSINDNYGHSTGDDVLRMIAEELMAYVGDKGLVGRFGGDEFLIVYLDGNEYDRIHDFYNRMFDDLNTHIFRRDYFVGEFRLFITATIGSASYPENADQYDMLFALMDKALYRGKFKGRNCFIIYVKEKHEHLEIPKLARRSLYDTLVRIMDSFQTWTDAMSCLRQAFLPMQEYLHLHYLFFVDSDNRMTNVMTGESLGKVEPITLLSPALLHPLHDLGDLKRACPLLSEHLTGLNMQSILIHVVSQPDARLGYLVFCPEPRTLHIWQDEECASALILARMMGRVLSGIL